MTKKKKITGTINDYPLVTIKWRDCLSDNNWMSIKKATRIEPAICHSIGYKLLDLIDLYLIITLIILKMLKKKVKK